MLSDHNAAHLGQATFFVSSYPTVAPPERKVEHRWEIPSFHSRLCSNIYMHVLLIRSTNSASSLCWGWVVLTRCHHLANGVRRMRRGRTGPVAARNTQTQFAQYSPILLGGGRPLTRLWSLSEIPPTVVLGLFYRLAVDCHVDTVMVACKYIAALPRHD